jgi:hypothetical protein
MNEMKNTLTLFNGIPYDTLEETAKASIMKKKLKYMSLHFQRCLNFAENPIKISQSGHIQVTRQNFFLSISSQLAIRKVIKIS